jgi:hypothetical protein
MSRGLIRIINATPFMPVVTPMYNASNESSAAVRIYLTGERKTVA